MAGIFPAPDGVAPALADNAYVPVNPPTGCSPSYYGPNCETLNHAWAMNAIVSELLAAVDKLGVAYNCARIDNLGSALATVVSSLTNQITANVNAVSSLAGRTSVAEADIAALEATTAAMATTLTALGSDVAGIQSYLAALNATQVALSPGLGPHTTVQQVVADLWARLGDIPANTLRGNNTGATGPTLNLAPADVTAMLPAASGSAKGLLPALSGLASDVLRGDGLWGPLPALSGGTTIFVSETPPVTPILNSLWWRSDIGVMFFYFDDGDSQQWVEVTHPAAIGFMAFPAGIGFEWWGPTAPSGTRWLDGAAYEQAALPALFTAIGTAYNTGGETGTQFRVPDKRGRVGIGRDNMGGTAAGRITNAGLGNPGIDGTTLGARGGVDRHTLSSSQHAAHQHATAYSNDTPNTPSGSGLTRGAAAGFSSLFTTMDGGGGQAHPNVQPGIVCNAVITTGGVA